MLTTQEVYGCWFIRRVEKQQLEREQESERETERESKKDQREGGREREREREAEQAGGSRLGLRAWKERLEIEEGLRGKERSSWRTIGQRRLV